MNRQAERRRARKRRHIEQRRASVEAAAEGRPRRKISRLEDRRRGPKRKDFL